MKIKEKCPPKRNQEVFEPFHAVSMGNKVYLISRHFIGSRDYVQAIFTAVENEAKRDDSIIQAG